MEVQVTWGLGWLGGASIGSSAALLWLANGRIAGVSGILAAALSPARADFARRLAFLSGLPPGASLVALATGERSST
jgi:uncharacterized protein